MPLSVYFSKWKLKLIGALYKGYRSSFTLSLSGSTHSSFVSLLKGFDKLSEHLKLLEYSIFTYNVILTTLSVAKYR